MKYVIAFDIVDNRARYRAVKTLLQYAYRVQKSVFEGSLSAEEAEECRAKLEKIIDTETDSLRFYPLCAKCEPGARVVGVGTKVEQVDYVIL